MPTVPTLAMGKGRGDAPATPRPSPTPPADEAKNDDVSPRPAAHIRRFSPSALNRYRTCPKSFWFADIERVPLPDLPKPKLAQANAVHHALERFYGLRPEQRTAPLLERALRSVWASHRKSDTFADRDEEAAYGREALAMLERYAQNLDLTTVPLAREQWVAKKLRGGVEIFGKADRIDPFEDGIAVIDYKTGTHAIEDDALRDEPAAQIYALAASAEFGRQVKCVRFIYIPLGREVVWTPELEDLQEIETRLTTLTREMRLQQQFEARPSSACRWCDYRLRCPDRQRVEIDDIAPVEDLPF